MARPRGNRNVANTRQQRQDNLASLSTEVLRLRLQALNLPITGCKAELVSRLKGAVQGPRPANQPGNGRVQKRPSSKRASRPKQAANVSEDTDAAANGDASEISSYVGSIEDLDELLDLSEEPHQSSPFTAAQMAAIQDTVRLSLQSHPLQSAAPYPSQALAAPRRNTTPRQKLGC